MNEKQLDLTSVPYSNFSKLEMARFATRLIDIIASHNPEELKIKPIYDLLVAEKPRISKLKDKFGPHPLTAELNMCREMRRLRISAIRFQLKVVLKENKGDVSKELIMVESEVNHFLNNLNDSKNAEMYNQKIAQFFETIASNPEIRTALTSLGFDKCLADLNEVHDDIQQLIYRKLTSIAARPQEKTADLIKKVMKAINIMTKQIEIAPFVNVDLDYEPLFNELNQFFADYRNMINKRLALNKKKAEKSVYAESDESTEITKTTTIKESIEEATKTTPNKDITNTTPIKVSNEDVLSHTTEKINLKEVEPLQKVKKKTAAMLSKTMQSPHIENDVVIET